MGDNINIIDLIKEDRMVDAVDALNALEPIDDSEDLFLSLKDSISNLKILSYEEKKIILSKLTLLFGVKSYFIHCHISGEETKINTHVIVEEDNTVGALQIYNNVGTIITIVSQLDVVVVDEDTLTYCNYLLATTKSLYNNLEDYISNFRNIFSLNPVTKEFEF